jgi:hypothetical protein
LKLKISTLKIPADLVTLTTQFEVVKNRTGIQQHSEKNKKCWGDRCQNIIRRDGRILRRRKTLGRRMKECWKWRKQNVGEKKDIGEKNDRIMAWRWQNRRKEGKHWRKG